MADVKLLSEEPEFAGRDRLGLQAVANPNTEAQERSKYIIVFSVVVLLGQIFAWSSYFLTRLDPHQKKLQDTKFAFLHEYQLGYVFLAVCIVRFSRYYVSTNANAARAPARLERPDQHIYKIMAPSGPLADAPYVLMAGTGAAGRFNRAQRAVANMDEALPLYLAETLLAGAVFGPLVPALAVIAALGRMMFARNYTHDLKSRDSGFRLSMTGETWISGLSIVCAVKVLCFTWLPF